MRKPLTPEQRERKRAEGRAYYERKIGRPVRKVVFGHFSDDPKAYHLRWHFEKKYGITVEQYNEMVQAQNGLCAICEGPPTHHGRLVVDHDHASGAIRGLLCWGCNVQIGRLRDSPGLVQKILDYLLEHAQLRLVKG